MSESYKQIMKRKIAEAKPPKAPQHTPTPWKQTGRHVTGGEYQTEAISVGMSGKTGKPHLETLHQLAFTVRKEEDAAFIVTAVNAHEELVKVLKMLQMRYTNNRPQNYDDAFNFDKIEQLAIEQALARAEGK